MEDVVYGKRSPYVLTNSGVVWQHEGAASEPKVLRFPVVEVGTREENLWCALGEFVHERRGGGEELLRLEPRSLLSRAKGKDPLRGSVAFAEIDLLEQRGPLSGWIQPLLEVPPSMPLVVDGEVAAARDRWVWEILGQTVAEDYWQVGVSYGLRGPGRDGGDQRVWLLLAAGDLSGHRGWRCLRHAAAQGPVATGTAPVWVPADVGTTPAWAPVSSLPPPPPASSLLPPQPVTPLPHLSQLSPPPPFPLVNVSRGHAIEPGETELAEVDLVQVSVDTLQIPTLRRRVVDGVRRARLARLEVH